MFTYRTVPPEKRKFESLEITRAELKHLGNNISQYIINSDNYEVIRIDLIFDAGISRQDMPLTASTTNAMLMEGTRNLSSSQIAGLLDFNGAYLNVEANPDTATVSLLSLNKRLPETITVLNELIKEPSFPEKELKVYLNKRKQNFIIDNSKVKVLAQRCFNELIFGACHPYGQKVEVPDFDNINNGQLIEFHSRHYTSDNCKIILSGLVNEPVTDFTGEYFGKAMWNNDKTSIFNNNVIEDKQPEKVMINKPDAVQSAIRIGKLMINRDHPDHTGMIVLNTVLGGYFGSRLMSKIREEKGYTYGIGSIIVSLQQAAYFFVSTEVAAEVVKECTNDIYTEIRKLREELITEEELNRVRSYMSGDLLRQFDGPFASADGLRTILDSNLDYSFYEQLFHTIRQITPMELNMLANKYLKEESFTEVVAGKNN